jgi:hypothetical protein
MALRGGRRLGRDRLRVRRPACRARKHPARDRSRARRAGRVSPWQAAPIYIVDVAEVAGAPRVMEPNPFSGADLYDCDLHAIVGAASRVALRLYMG